MKKNFFMLAATAALFAACAETDLVNEVNTVAEPQAIGFETFANKATRAEGDVAGATTTTALETHHESFKVWASKQLGVEGRVYYSPVYNPGTVSINADDEWIASPLRFWDKAALNYYFYAAAPTSATWAYNNTEGDDSNGYLTLADYKLVGTNLADGTANALVGTWKGETDANDDKDLMVATKVSRDDDSYKGETIDKVNFEFRHILSKLNIKVKGIDLSAYNATITLDKLDVCNLICKGSFNDNNAAEWTLSESEEDVYNLPMTDGSSTLELTDSYVYTHEYLVMPQEVALLNKKNVGVQPEGVYLYIQYTITTTENGGTSSEVFKTYYGLADIFGNSALEFNDGRQNTLAVTISPDIIEFEVETDELGWDNTEEVPVDSPEL